ncbi:hypothetical protein H0H87_006698 [Tephrocybe sp. NHM501043]|nr:hypothetical protein H0H87_006698 [Tephrocybe sp. NHM501043]
MAQLNPYKRKQEDLVCHTQDEHATHIEELQKKIAVLEEDVQDRHKRLEIELNEKSKTAIQVQTSISLLNDRLLEEQVQKMEYKTSSESAMEQVTKLNAMINKLQNNLKIQDVHVSSNTARYQKEVIKLSVKIAEQGANLKVQEDLILHHVASQKEVAKL